MAKKLTTYHRLLKEFTKINKLLPEDRKVSLKQRRQIIKETLLPKYKEIPKYKQRVKDIKATILGEVDKLPPKEICDINYLDESDFGFVEWYALDETISELIPDCINVKVSAGIYGETRIFNTLNYEYGRKGVRDIVEAIRPDANNSSGRFIFSGYKKLKPRKLNDGTPDNYYLDFVLFEIDSKGNERAYGNTDAVEYEVPKTRENRKIKTKVNKIIEQRIKKLKSKKDSRKRARKTLEKNIKQLQTVGKKANKKSTPTNEFQRAKQLNKTLELLEKYKKEGKVTQAAYDKELKRIFKSLE